MHVFRLTGSYEYFLEQAGEKKLIRVEVLKSIDEPQIFRARVWLQNTYNLYPTFLNLGDHGEDLKRMYSSDHLNTEITTLIAESPEWVTGIQCESETAFFVLVQGRATAWFKEMDQMWKSASK